MNLCKLGNLSNHSVCVFTRNVHRKQIVSKKFGDYSDVDDNVMLVTKQRLQLLDDDDGVNFVGHRHR